VVVLSGGLSGNHWFGRFLVSKQLLTGFIHSDQGFFSGCPAA
jgi:hypothetical protein